MHTISICMALFIAGAAASPAPREISGFSYVGSFASSFYYLSNINDKRTVSDARVGCEDSFHNGQLVALETDAEHQDVRRRLASWGVSDDDRIWTTGQYDARTSQWVWYDLFSGTASPILNACAQPWTTVNGCTAGGCLAIGGRDLSYGWEADVCSIRRRYLCEYHEDGC